MHYDWNCQKSEVRNSEKSVWSFQKSCWCSTNFATRFHKWNICICDNNRSTPTDAGLIFNMHIKHVGCTIVLLVTQNLNHLAVNVNPGLDHTPINCMLHMKSKFWQSMNNITALGQSSWYTNITIYTLCNRHVFMCPFIHLILYCNMQSYLFWCNHFLSLLQ